uniref:Pleckstrin homology domain-containing family G member 1 n=1 Tax=Plectus sambesii TaxID=2011161 RepID=A0A914VEI5_9BILA
MIRGGVDLWRNCAGLTGQQRVITAGQSGQTTSRHFVRHCRPVGDREEGGERRVGLIGAPRDASQLVHYRSRGWMDECDSQASHLAPSGAADDYDDLENYCPSVAPLEQNGNRQSPAPAAQLNTPLPSDLRSEPLSSSTTIDATTPSAVLQPTPPTSRRQRYHRCDSESNLRPYRIISGNASEQLLLWQAARAAAQLGLAANDCDKRPALRAKLKKVLAPTGSTNNSSGATLTAGSGSSGGKPRRASLSSNTIVAKNKVSSSIVDPTVINASDKMPMDAGKVKAFRSLSFEKKNKRASSSPEQECEDNQRLSFISTSTGYSSARSSLRSSDTSDDTSTSFDSTGTASISCFPRHFLSEEASLSHHTRCELLRSGDVTHLNRIAMELLDTERCYVNDLNDIIQGYLNFLIRERDSLGVTTVEICTLFGCIEKVFKFNRQLYQALDAAQLNTSLMAKCFIDYSDGFACYAQYCAQYQKMVSTLAHLEQNPLVADSLAGRQGALGHALPLNSYLLKPVQRVLKYHLFLENILKSSKDAANVADKEVTLIKKALECMTSRAKEINEVKKREEHAVRVKELQAMLQRWNTTDQCEDLSQYGDLVLEANFKLLGTKTNRQLFLFEEMLLIAKEKPDKTLCCKDYILCSSLMLNESVAGEPFAFQVLAFDNPRLQYTLITRNMEQKRQWTKELKRMMLDHYNIEIPEHTKNLVLSMETPKPRMWASNSTSSSASRSSNSKKVPKYLEKRRKSSEHNRQLSHQRSQSASRVVKAASTSNLHNSPPVMLSKDDSCQTPQQTSTRHQSFFTRRKSGDLSRVKFFAARKKASLPPTPIRFENGFSPSRYFDDSGLYIDSPPSLVDFQPKTSHSAQPSQPSAERRLLQTEEIERTFEELWNELNQFSFDGGNGYQKCSTPSTSKFPLASVTPSSQPTERLNRLIDGATTEEKAQSLPKLDCEVSADDEEDSSVVSCYDTLLELDMERKLSWSSDGGDNICDKHVSFRKNTAPFTHLVNIRDCVKSWEKRRHSFGVFSTPSRHSTIDLDPHLGVVQAMVRQFEAPSTDARGDDSAFQESHL